jgi:hypothetical protein
MSRSFVKARSRSPSGKSQFTRLDDDEANELSEYRALYNRLLEKASHEVRDIDEPLLEPQQVDTAKALNETEAHNSQVVFDLMKIHGWVLESETKDITVGLDTLHPTLQHILRQFVNTNRKPQSPRPSVENASAKVKSFVKASLNPQKALSKKFILRDVNFRPSGKEAGPARPITKIENIGLHLQKEEVCPLTFIPAATKRSEAVRCANCCRITPEDWELIECGDVKFCSFNCMLRLASEDATIPTQNPPTKWLKSAPSPALLKSFGGFIDDDRFYAAMKNEWGQLPFNILVG